MKQYVLGFLCSIMVFTVTLFFNNCAQTSQGNLFDIESLNECNGSDCRELTKQEMLEVKVNKPETFWVTKFEQRINVGGDCNEGEFDDHRIEWTLHERDVNLMTSESRYSTTGDDAYRAQCVNGRFTLLIDFMDADGLLRTGLEVGPQYLEHRLEIQIMGIDTNDKGEEVQVMNPAFGPEIVILQPLCLDKSAC